MASQKIKEIENRLDAIEKRLDNIENTGCKVIPLTEKDNGKENEKSKESNEPTEAVAEPAG